MPIRTLLVALLISLAAQASPQNADALKASAGKKLDARDYDGALEDFEQALAAVSAAPSPLGPGSPEAAALSLDVAKVLFVKADYRGSKAMAERALSIYQKVNGAESALVARALNAIGVAVEGQGDYASATPIFERALALAHKTIGFEARETVEIQEQLAYNFLIAGEVAKAKIVEEQALEICERRFGPQDALTGHALRLLGQVLTAMGDYPSAEKYQLRSLAVLQEKVGADAAEVGDVLITMGNGAGDSGEYARAQEYFERAAAIYEKRLGPHNTRLGGALDSLGQAFTHLKKYPQARIALERALAIQTQELGPTHPWTGNVIQGLAKVEDGAGNYAKARDLYEQNLAIWRDRLGATHPFTVTSVSLLSDVLAHLGQNSAALDLALDAARIRREDILLTVRTVDERQALRYASLHIASMDTALTIASRPDCEPRARAKVWDALIQSRALVLDEMGARHRSVLESKDPEAADFAQRVAGARSQITRLVLQGPGKSTAVEYAAKVERSRAELAQAEEALAIKSADFRRELKQRRTGYDDVRAALQPGSALVGFRRYRRKNYATGMDGGTESYMAFVQVGPGAVPALVNLGSAVRIEQLVRAWRSQVDRERAALGRSGIANEASYRVAAAALRTAVWDPVQRRLGAAKRVYIVPDGALQLVNFAALPSSGGRYLVEDGPLLHLLSAERDLAEPAQVFQSTELLAVADPQFQSKPTSNQAPELAIYRGPQAGCANFASVRFGNLPGSLDEVNAILQIWNGRGWHGVALTGGAASETAVKNAMAGKRVIHLATHAFFLEAECPGTAVSRENPLLRSGLALTGANLRQTAGANQDDGILTAEEVASLDLDGTEWVVLSACDTGLGDIKAGEGVLGLRRAFQEAGAQTLITSLWQVDDQAARQWMTGLYRARFVEGKNTAEAIRDADLAQVRKRRREGKTTHPFYWAGFVAVGAWR